MSVPNFESTESTEPAGVEDAPVGTPEDSGASAETSSGHPAWAEILDVLPTSLHPIVQPALQKWDQGVQERFQQVQSKYDPYKDILESAQPDDLQKALQITRMLESDPQGFYARLGQAVGTPTNDQGQPGTEDEEDVYDLGDNEANLPPEVKQQIEQMRQQQEMLVQHVQSQMQAEANTKAEQELEQILTSLRDEHGEFDEEYVLNYAMANGNSFAAIEKGVQKYNELVGRLQGVPAPGSNLPKVHAPGGATPSTAIDPATLDSRDTKSLVVNLLQQANAQSN